MRAASSSRPAGRGRRGLRHPADGRDRAALSRGGRKSTVATTTEVWHFLRLLYVKLGLQHCVKDGSPVRAQSAESIAAQLLRDHTVSTSGCSRRWSSAQGRLHRPRQVGEGARPHAPGVDGEFVPVSPWPRLDRFKEHTIELPVGDIVDRPGHEGRAARLLAQTLELGKGVMHLLRRWTACTARCWPAPDRAHRRGQGVLDQARLPGLRHQLPELDPRMFSYNSKHGWCTTCVGTGLALTREQRKAYDDSVRDDDDKGREQSFPSEESEVEAWSTSPAPIAAARG
jgi:excinuclease ABC subunit A